MGQLAEVHALSPREEGKQKRSVASADTKPIKMGSELHVTYYYDARSELKAGVLFPKKKILIRRNGKGSLDNIFSRSAMFELFFYHNCTVFKSFAHCFSEECGAP